MILIINKLIMLNENINNKFDWNKFTFNVVNKMFSDNYLIKKIQIEPYNDFVEYLIPTIISQYNPLVFNYYEEQENMKYELKIEIKNPRLICPTVCENNGSV